MNHYSFIISLAVVLSFIFPRVNLHAEEFAITNSTTIANITPYIEVLEDRNNSFTIDDVSRKSNKWEKVAGSSISYGFVHYTYWFRFTLTNKTTQRKNFYFEINYAMMDHIEFYLPEEKGRFRVVKTGRRHPFGQREIIDRNFLFPINEGPGPDTYYIKITTTSSLNFTPAVLSQYAYISRLSTDYPIWWMYYGIMLIMAVYNLFVLLSIRDRSYLYYVSFIISYAVLQASLSGHAYQYLWPNSIWWGTRSLPVLMCCSVFTMGLFARSYMDAKNRFKKINLILLIICIAPSILWMVLSFFVPYPLAIKVSTLMSFIGTTVPFICLTIAAFLGSREAVYGSIASSTLSIASIVYILKTIGILPNNMATTHAPLIGSGLLVVLFGFGLTDKIHMLRKSMMFLNKDLEQSQKETKERASFLEEIIRSARDLSQTFSELSGDLLHIGNNFALLAREQAASSEEMTATFEELIASNENIYKTTISQKTEGEATKNMVLDLNSEHQNTMNEGKRLLESITLVSQNAKATEKNLEQMFDKMTIINDQGENIDQFIVIINDISDRINLLSLNAAIEAARAGEHGRGFAIVAQEIGKLAMATAENSKEISNQISSIIRDINEGTSIVSETKNSTNMVFSMVGSIRTGIDSVGALLNKQVTALDGVIRQTDMADSLSNKIVTAYNEQNSSMQHTMRTIERLSQMAQEISESNEKIINSTKILKEKSDELLKIINNT